MQLITVVGAESGPSHLEFGDIVGLSVDSARGYLFMVDGYNYRLSAFTLDGEFIDAAGRKGSGPAEFALPSAPYFHDSLLHVADPLNGRISQWGLEDGRLVHRGQIRLPFPLSNRLCGAAGHLYVLYFHEGGLIQKVDLGRRTVTRFGSPLYEAPGLNPSFVSGLIACDQRKSAVYVANGMSSLRKYDGTSGRLAWDVAIPGVVPPKVEVDGRTGLPQFRRPEGEVAVVSIVSVVPGPDGLLLLQTGVLPPGPKRPGYSGTDVVDVQTIVYDEASGRVHEIRADLPRIDYAIGDRVYSRASMPFPQVRIFRWR